MDEPILWTKSCIKKLKDLINFGYLFDENEIKKFHILAYISMHLAIKEDLNIASNTYNNIGKQ